MNNRKKPLTIISGILWVLVVVGIVIIFTDYTLVKKDKDPIFCIKYEVKENIDGNTSICTGFAYKYYHTIGSGYVSKKFVPIWQKDVEDMHE
jgi:hypothetical protein